MKEDQFVEEALAAAEEILAPPLLIIRHASLLYQVTVNNRLEVTVNPRKLSRGHSAFQTDLCVFEDIDDEIRIPRVVLEFKSRVSTHDVITYSAKARKHKQVYPYLRYGLVIANESTVPGRFFTHNEGLDFCVAAASYKAKRVHEIFASLLRDEVAASRRLEGIAFEKTPVRVFRSEILLEGGTGKWSDW
jgi:hypothetical protein